MFSAVHKDENEWKKSSSGGAFTAITDGWFESFGEKAVVYGCAFDENLNVMHIRAADRETRNKMRGSKYIGSDLTGVFKRVKSDLKNEMYVCFSGTPCQIGALKKYLSLYNLNDAETLLTVEVICHGVASTLFFNDYIKHFEEKYRHKVVRCSFRAKHNAFKKQDMELVFENGKKYNASSTKYDWFYSVYHKNLLLRPSCYNCKYATEKRCADISIADHWSHANNNKKAQSLVMANTEKGLLTWEKGRGSMDWNEIDESMIHQPNLHNPTKKPSNYEKFWDVYLNEGYLPVQEYMGNNTFKGKLKSCIVFFADRTGLIAAAKKLKGR